MSASFLPQAKSPECFWHYSVHWYNYCRPHSEVVPDFPAVPVRDRHTIIDKLDNRPRKYLGTKAPNQVFFGIKPTVALAS